MSQMRVCNCCCPPGRPACQLPWPNFPTLPATPWSPTPGVVGSSCSKCFYYKLPAGAKYCPNCGTFVGVLGSPT